MYVHGFVVISHFSENVEELKMADVEVIDFTIPNGPGHVLYLPGIE